MEKQSCLTERFQSVEKISLRPNTGEEETQEDSAIDQIEKMATGHVEVVPAVGQGTPRFAEANADRNGPAQT